MKTDILNQYQKIMDRAIRLADINNPESRDIERVMNAEGLYEQLKDINWFDLLQEMSENSEYYSFKGVFHALSGATPEGYGPISGRRVRQGGLRFHGWRQSGLPILLFQG